MVVERVLEHNVARFWVEVIEEERLEVGEQDLDPWPIVLEQFPSAVLVVQARLLGELRVIEQFRFSEVDDVRGRVI